MAENNKTNSFFKGISINQVLNIVAITLSVVAIILSIIAISAKPNPNCGNAQFFRPNQVWDINRGNNPMDGNNRMMPGFGQRSQRNNQNPQNPQNNGFDKGPNVQNDMNRNNTN